MALVAPASTVLTGCVGTQYTGPEQCNAGLDPGSFKDSTQQYVLAASAASTLDPNSVTQGWALVSPASTPVFTPDASPEALPEDGAGGTFSRDCLAKQSLTLGHVSKAIGWWIDYVKKNVQKRTKLCDDTRAGDPQSPNRQRLSRLRPSCSRSPFLLTPCLPFLFSVLRDISWCRLF